MEKVILTKKINASDWNHVLKNSKDANISQSPEYYDALNQKHEFTRILAYQNAVPVALLQGKIYRLKRLPFLKKLVIGNMSGSGIAIIDSKNTDDTLIVILIKLAEKEKIDIIELWTFDRPDLEGYMKKDVYTIILNLNKSTEELWQGIDRKTRNVIKKAEKNNVSVIIDDLPEIKKYYDIYKTTAERGNFYAIDYQTLDNATKRFTEKKMLTVFSAYYEEKIVSFAYILRFKNELYYWIGASSKESHKVAASDLLQWKIIEWGAKNNYTSYNMWGADPNPSSDSYGVYKFKIGFGGDLRKVYISRRYLNRTALTLYKLKDIYMNIKEKIRPAT